MSTTEPFEQPDERPPTDPLPPILNAELAESFTPVPSPLPPSLRPPRPFPLHPGFWWGTLWSLGMVITTQGTGGVIAAIVLVAAILVQGQAGQQLKQEDMYEMPVFSFAMGLGLGLAHVLMFILSLVLLRIIIGPDWKRQVALRVPAWHHVLLVVLLTPAFLLLANGSYQIVQKVFGFPSFSDVPGMVAFLGSVCLALAVMGLATLTLGEVFGYDWPRRFYHSAPDEAPVVYSIGLLGAFFGLAIVFNLGFHALGISKLLGGAGAGADMTGMEKMFNSWPYPVAVFLIGVLPSFSEEFFCRAFLGRGFVGKHGYVWGVILTSFLFGLIHIDPCQGSMAVIVGLVLHYIYLTTRSLVLPMLMHFINNSLAVTLSRLPEVSRLEHEADTIPWWVFVSAAVLMVCVLWVLYHTRARLVAPEGVDVWKPEYPGVVCPPAESGTTVQAPVSAVGLVVVVVAFVILSGGVALLFVH